MNCTEFELELETAVEARTVPSRIVREHASLCAHCRPAWQSYELLHGAVALWKTQTRRPDLVAAVLAELANPDLGAHDDAWDFNARELNSTPGVASSTSGVVLPLRPRQRRGAFLSTIAAAACLCVAMVSISLWPRSAPPQMTRQPHTPSPTTDIVAVDMSRTLSGVISELTSEYREVANETSAIARDMASVLPQSAELSPVPAADEFEIFPKSSEMVRMFQPISSSVGNAFGFLRQTIPATTPSG